MLILLFAALMLLASPCEAQGAGTAGPQGTAYVDLAGNALFGATLNGEVFVGPQLAMRLGFGADAVTRTKVVPMQAVVLLGSGRSRFEIGAGVTIAREKYSGDWHWNGTKAFASGFIGYRYQRERGVMVHVGVVPLMWTNRKLPWGTIGVGRSF